MARIPYPPDTALSEETSRALASVPPLNIFRLLAHGEPALRNFLRLTGGLWDDAELSPRRRELAILQVARLTGAEYEWHQHVAVARLVGVTEGELEALDRGAVDEAPFAEDDRVLLSLVGVIVARNRAADELFAAARRVLTDRELVELHLLVGVYAGLAALMIDLDLDLDEQLGVELLDSGPRGPRLGGTG
jgi:alkylhydroperoxidase family enzyme